MNAVDERGYFWWRKEKIPKGLLAPENGAYGKLSIDEKGLIELELDAHLQRDRNPFDLVLNNELDCEDIVGILRPSNSFVILGEAYSAGRTIGIRSLSHEKIRAHYCLVAPISFAANKRDAFINSIDLSFEGVDEWLNEFPIDIKEGRKHYSAKYNKIKINHEPFNDKRLTIIRDIDAPSSSYKSVKKLSMSIDILLRIDKFGTITPQEAIDWHIKFQDFMILMTGVEKSIAWPIVGLSGKKYKAKLYYWRGIYNNVEPTRSDLWLYFGEIKDNLAKLFIEWCKIRSDYGPGVYLYLATRRGKDLYNEHNFISLIWGLESLHRLAYPQTENAALNAKIQRIAENIINEKDRKWFLRQSEYKAEPRLSDRLFDIITSVDIGLDQTKLREYLENCARVRNDISHFGGEKKPGEKKYDAEFLITARYILGYLYHAVLLQKIGIDQNLIFNIFTRGAHSYKFRQWIKRAGLNIRTKDM